MTIQTLQLSYPFNATTIDFDDQVHEALTPFELMGDEDDVTKIIELQGSGAGFGRRDLEYFFTIDIPEGWGDEGHADERVRNLIAALNTLGFRHWEDEPDADMIFSISDLDDEDDEDDDDSMRHPVYGD